MQIGDWRIKTVRKKCFSEVRKSNVGIYLPKTLEIWNARTKIRLKRRFGIIWLLLRRSLRGRDRPHLELWASLDGGREICAVLLLFMGMAIISPAQTLTTLLNFNGTNGEQPIMGRSCGRRWKFLRNDGRGGALDDGTIFKMTAGGTLTTLYSFSGGDGSGPYGGLIQATDGNFYGTTYRGRR